MIKCSSMVCLAHNNGASESKHTQLIHQLVRAPNQKHPHTLSHPTCPPSHLCLFPLSLEVNPTRKFEALLLLAAQHSADFLSCSFHLVLMSASSTVSARDLVKKWACISAVADPPDQREIDRLAEALKSFTRAEALRLVRGAMGAPTLCSYSNDGTPQTVRKRVVTSGAGGSFAREGGASRELLCQRSFFSHSRQHRGLEDSSAHPGPSTPGARQGS